jgi:dynein intermediate chain
MDSEAIRKKRQEDIEAKRKKLEELRKSASSRNQENVAVTPTAPTPPPVPQKAPEPQPTRTEDEVTQELVNSLLTERVKPNVVEGADDPVEPREVSLRKKLGAFTTVKSFHIIDILPGPKEVYDKGTQMEDGDLLFSKGSEETFDPEPDQTAVTEENEGGFTATPVKNLSSPTSNRLLTSSKKTPTPNRAADDDIDVQFAEKATIKLSEEERSKITAASGFQSFLRTTSLYVERALALAEVHDVIRDFSTDEKGTAGDLDEHSAFIAPAAGTAGASHAATTYEDGHVVGRPVMGMQWSHIVPELFLAAYGTKQAPASTGGKGGAAAAPSRATGAEEEAPGLVCVWSRDLHGRPEYRFTASSPVLAAVFHSQEQHLVLGGCYSGQILLWDMKLNKALPVQRSSMSGKWYLVVRVRSLRVC